ncbi:MULTISPECIES: MacS family sensor histidine kinase [unclassified Knoellia]|uniref:MacS family sensor histidine kinase n=1 Tax=Knoellia altitudinis TaxID=3404795 RepID=UPI003617DE9F
MNRRGALFGVTYRSVRTGRSEPVIVEAFSRGLDYFRPAAALYAGSVVWARHDTMARPWVAFTVIGVLMAFSLLLLVFRRRTTWLLAVEVALAVGGIFATLLADHPEDVAAGQFTLPTIWAAGGVVGAAVLHGRLGGLVVAGIIAAADLVEIGSPTQTTWHNILLLVLLGVLIGLAVDLARGGLHRYEQVLAERERLRERERLARVVHDGVLQTLAFIHRRGEELGGEGAELGAMAAEQERTLRRLVSQDVTGAQPPGAFAVPAGVVRQDLRLLLGAHEGERVSVSLPGGPVPFEGARAEELDAAVVAALDNVHRHAGDDARAWLLLEDHGDTVSVTVRDNGVGDDPDHLLSAASRGRLGVSQSIVGRARDLGGTADVITRPGGGCRVVITVPREESA